MPEVVLFLHHVSFLFAFVEGQLLDVNCVVRIRAASPTKGKFGFE